MRLAKALDLFGQAGRRHHAIDHAELERFFRAEYFGGEIQFARLGRTDQLRQQIGAAEVARKADAGERGAEACGCRTRYADRRRARYSSRRPRRVH